MTKLFNDLGCQYLIDISVGTPKQKFTVTIDTGSADFWIPGKLCPPADCPRTLFDPSASSTFKSLNKPFVLSYGIGHVNGTYVTDTLSIAGATVPNQQFALAFETKQILTNVNTISFSAVTNTSKRDDEPKSNGLLGLGFPRLTAASSSGQGAYVPFVFSLVERDIISEPIFSIYMNKVGMSGWVGEVIFGGIDQTKFKNNMTYIPVISLNSLGGKSKKRAEIDTKNNYYWMVKARGIALTDKTSNNTHDSAITLSFDTISAYVLDTGTTLTYLPPPMAEKVITSIAGSDGFTYHGSSGTYIVNCSAAHSNVQLELIMSDHKNPISLAVTASQLVIPLDAPTADKAKTCLFGIAPAVSNLGNNIYLVGDSILRSTYLVFDMRKSQIGIAPAIGFDGKIQSTSFFFSEQDSESKAIQNHPMYTLSLICFVLVFIYLW